MNMYVNIEICTRVGTHLLQLLVVTETSVWPQAGQAVDMGYICCYISLIFVTALLTDVL